MNATTASQPNIQSISGIHLDSRDMTPSSLWARAAGIDPVGPVWSGDQTQCVMCGAAVHAGNHATPTSADWFDPAFNFKLDCKHDGRAICGHCQALWSKQWMQTSSKSVAIAGQGVFNLMRAEDIARFIVEPPTSPYVAIWNTRQQAHMIWRTPVALPDERWIQIRLDDEILQIDRYRVLEAVGHWQTALRVLKACGKPKSQPFLYSYNMSSTMVGKPIGRHGQAIRSHSEEGRLAMEALESLAMADWWALCSLRDRSLGELTPATLGAPPRRRIEVATASDAAGESDEATDSAEVGDLISTA
ncbi:MAG: hypothetical protein O9327_02040 [Polaromonas sp.]|nr:hypothetical protein [Polaromonas sp.]